VKILLIHPNEIENIYIQEGKDLLTMITCHPYGVGTHRYVLICERFNPNAPGLDATIYPKTNEIIVSDGLIFESSYGSIIRNIYFPFICFIASGFVLIGIGLLWRKKHISHPN